MLSDFIEDERGMAALDDALKIAAGRHDLVAIRVWDAREAEMPDVGIVTLADAETGEKVWVDTSSLRVREHYAAEWRALGERIEQTLRHNRTDVATVATEGDYVAELIKLFRQR